jgi:hypothetical protein
MLKEDISDGKVSEDARNSIPVEGRIAVLFGYGYNEPEFVAKTLAALNNQFAGGNEEELVLPLLFPNDFRYGRISLLNDMLGEHRVGGLIAVGAPERTHAALARLQDSWKDTEGGYPVISLSPQDDALGIEAGSDLVLDIAFEQDEELLEEQSIRRPEDAPEIIGALIRYVCLLQTMKQTVNPQSDLEELFGALWNIRPYLDPETGLRSLNHFIIEKKDVS